MEPAAQGLREALDDAPFAPPRFPVIANASAAAVTGVEEARRLLAEQLTAPVRWTACMETAATSAPGSTFVEVGPGSVLSGLLRKILPGAPAFTLGTADEVEKFLQ
jgi:[acyl-carrier-protein] S-malonyltransferase